MASGDREQTGDGLAGEVRVVARFPGVPDAALAASALESAGIEARLRDQYAVGINWLWSFALGGVGVEVPEGRSAEAVEVLEMAGLGAEPLSGAEERAYAGGRERRRWRGLWAIFLISPWLWLISWPAWRRRRRREVESGED